MENVSEIVRLFLLKLPFVSRSLKISKFFEIRCNEGRFFAFKEQQREHIAIYLAVQILRRCIFIAN